MHSIALNREDWGVEREESSDDDLPPDPLATLGDLQSLGEAFLGQLSPWLREPEESFRLAFGAILIAPVATRAEGYALLGSQIPCLNVDPQSRDLLYQINRPRQLSIGDGQVRINRLSKWSVMAASLSQIQLDLGGEFPEFLGGQQNVAARYAARVELDVNTAPERRDPFPAAEVEGLVRGMFGMACEISAKGEVP